MIEINLPYKFNSKNMSVTPYLEQTKKETLMSKKDIILRLETALEDKDWDAIELLLEDIQYDEEEKLDQGYDQFVDDYEDLD